MLAVGVVTEAHGGVNHIVSATNFGAQVIIWAGKCNFSVVLLLGLGAIGGQLFNFLGHNLRAEASRPRVSP